jgi:gluconate kinase
MNPNLLRSQFETLEEPMDALQIDASLSPEEIARQIRKQFSI